MAGEKSPRRTKKRSAANPKRNKDRTVVERDEEVANRFARVTAPRELDDPEKRKKWELPGPDEPDKRGAYIIELNAQNVGGLAGAAHAFVKLFDEVVAVSGDLDSKAADLTAINPDKARESLSRKPLQISKSYYRCALTDAEWRNLVREDEKRTQRDRAIYKLWPDFPVKAQTDRSIATIKADAALRSFDAAGEKITWAVIDSGVYADHPHFGAEDDPEQHSLWSKDVADLHRCFADVFEKNNNVWIYKGPLENPDLDPNIDEEKRRKIIDEHRKFALRDDFGHGTHVAGIIAGQAPPSPSEICVLERQYKMDENGNKMAKEFARRSITGTAKPRGVAPRCKIISLRVLDHQGKGRASQIIQALEYIRERINDTPKLMRVHGVNLSVGYEFDAEMFACGQSPLCNEVNRLVQEGVVVVSAAGNTGYGTVAAEAGAAKTGLSNSINDHGNADLAITVGSTHRDAPHTYGVSYFSSKGPTGDGRLKPDLVAPGERITSCAAGEKLQNAINKNGSPGNNQAAFYIDDSGTSMAAPHVSGAVAAFLSIRREFIGKPLDVKRIFLESATPLGRERYFEGHGLVDLMRAIQSV